MQKQQTLLSVQDLAKRWGFSARHIYNATGRKPSGRFPVRPIRIGGAVRFRLADVEEFEQNGGQYETND